MPKVSVVTGYYNRRDHLEGTIRSILGQTFNDLELIVFDDASPDGTGPRLLELAEELQDPRLKPILHERNLGFTRGMVNAIAASKGEYIAVQGSGDISLPRRIELQVAHLDNHPEVGAVGCHYTNVVADSGVRRVRQPDAANATVEKLRGGDNPYSHGEVMFRRKAYDEAGGYRPAFVNSQDIDLWLRIVCNYKLATVKEQLYERYVRMDGVSYSPAKFALQARYSMLARRFSRMSSEQQALAVSELEREGPLKLVPKEDPELQYRYIKAALRSMVWGAFAESRQLIRENVIGAPKRRGLLLFADTLETSIGKPMLRVLQKFFKVN